MKTLLNPKFLLVLLLSLLPFITSMGQEKQKSKKSFSKWGLQFETRSLLNLYAFEGGTISLKHLLNKCSALRLGLTLEGGNLVEDGKGEADTIFTRTESRTLTLELSMQYLLINRINKNLNLYYGAGPLIAYHISKENIDYKLRYGNKYLRESKSLDAGLKIVLGAEWFFLNYMSLSGEYDFSAAFRYVKGKDLNQDLLVETKGDGYYFNNDVKLGLTIYF